VDAHAPNAYGAGITYDLPVGVCEQEILDEIDESLSVKHQAEHV
jgi:NitT/TauT family transport system ATP-binding protein